MARVAYALMPTLDAAKAVAEELARHKPPFAVQIHRRELQKLDLHEDATEVGRNNVIGTVAGALIGAAFGGIGASLVKVTGLTPISATIVGMFAGIAVGYMTAMMNGARVPKAPLRALEPQLTPDNAILTVTIEDAARIRDVLDRLEAGGGESSGIV
jgi:ribose/xylose/arabinose/galactoside ABC-type transport system permease subunit